MTTEELYLRRKLLPPHITEVMRNSFLIFTNTQVAVRRSSLNTCNFVKKRLQHTGVFL